MPSAAYGAAVAVTDPAALAANDSVLWSQLGGDGTTIGTSFSATSQGGITLSGSLVGDDSLVSVVCPDLSGCSWAGSGVGFMSGDSLIWTSTADDSTDTGGNGPLTLTLGTPVFGGGLWIDSDGSAPGNFTAQVVAFNSLDVPLGTFTNTSTGTAGDPVFLGVLDTTPDVAQLVYTLTACTLQNCNDTSFAVDTLELNTASTATPEPSTVLLFLSGLCIAALLRSGRKAAALAPAVLAVFAFSGAANAQSNTPITLPANLPLKVIDGSPIAKNLTKISINGASSSSSPASLPLWNYTFTAGKDGNNYSVTAVGQSPLNKGARTVKVPVVIVPLILQFTFTGGNITYDPTAGDTGCLGAGNTAAGLTNSSPIFNNYPFTAGSVNLGTTQYEDAFQRAEFWTSVSASGGAYHLLLSPVTTAPAQTLTFANSYANGSNAATYGFNGQCGSTPLALGSTNPQGGLGLVNINTIDPLLQGIIASLGITPNQFALFVLYNSAMTDGPVTNGSGITNCCILGYHNSEGVSNAIPGQTYGIADFEGRNQTLFGGTSDTSAMSHEVGEWINDPGGANPAPNWGGIGQVGGCQNNWEVGDPLTGTLLPTATLNGFTYHLQELAFFSWFYGGASSGVNGWYSNNGTFTGYSKACPPGGTN